MIDRNKIVPIISGYKNYFPAHWENEKYKWEAVKCFQDNWNIKATDFAEMLAKSLTKTANLLATGHWFPRRMIKKFAEVEPETVKSMFETLYDESKPLDIRIRSFIDSSEEIRAKYADVNDWNSHYQNTNAVSVYLWLRYPDKYYIYKYELYKKCAELLDDTYRPKGNGGVENVIDGYKMYDEIRTVLSSDIEFWQMLESVLDDSCYPDTELVTATIDFGFYAARFYEEESVAIIDPKDDWFPSPEEYTPGLSVEDWFELLNDKTVFTQKSLEVIEHIYENGGQASCKELAEKYGETVAYYVGQTSGLAKRINKKTNCPILKNSNDKEIWYTIPYVGRYDSEGKYYLWKLRDELMEALDMLHDNNADNSNAWLLTWNPKQFDWENIEEPYTYNAMIEAVRNGDEFLDCWRCTSTKVKKGDKIFFIRLGVEPKGIFATGYADSDSYYSDDVRVIDTVITDAFDYKTEAIIPQDTLKQLFPEQQWSPQPSGISINSEAAKWLVEHWNEYQSTTTNELVNLT